MIADRQPLDDWDDAHMARLLKSACGAPEMREALARGLAQRLDAAFEQGRLLPDGAAGHAPSSNGASLTAESDHDSASPHKAAQERALADGAAARNDGQAAGTAAAQSVEPAVLKGSLLKGSRTRRWPRWAVATCVAASLVAALVMWSSRPAYGWAAMIDALDRCEWVQATVAGEQQTDAWLSAANGIVAVRTERIVVFVDRRRRAATTFVGDDQKVYQSAMPLAPSWNLEAEFVRMLLGAASSDRAEPSAAGLDQISRVDVVRESWRDVQRDGAALVEARVTLRVERAASAAANVVSLLLLVDAETHLPIQVRLLDGDRETGWFDIAFPEQGPESIYSLGVPAALPIESVSSTPPQSRLPAADETKEPQPAEDRTAGASSPALESAASAEPAERSLLTAAKPSLENVEASWMPFDEPLAVDELSERVDRQLAAHWRRLGIQPAEPATDDEFARRVYLDLTGRIPRVSEVRLFEEDASAERRTRLVDELLAERDHATHLAAVWRRILLPDDVDLSRFGGHAKFEQWLAERFAANMPYDQIVRELLIAEGRVSESGPLVFYAALKLNPEELAAQTSRAFLGVRMECAQCHDHPFDDVSQKDFWSFAAFFARISRPQGKMEMASPVLRVRDSQFGEALIPESDEVVAPRLPGSDVDVTDALADAPRREQLVRWLTARDNAQFARATVNRVWAHLYGRGLVEPVDDMRPSNAPVIPEVLDTLSRDFAASGFDLRRLLRALVLSESYQLSSRAAVHDAARTLHFAQMNIKTFTAEQLYDCIAVAAQQADAARGASTSLVRFDDASRQAFVDAFRAPPGPATDYQAGIPLALALMHGGLIHNATDLQTSGLLHSLAAPFFTDEQRLDTLFLATLSRHPTAQEQELMLAELAAASDPMERRQMLGDVLWALLNSGEFLFNH